MKLKLLLLFVFASFTTGCGSPHLTPNNAEKDAFYAIEKLGGYAEVDPTTGMVVLVSFRYIEVNDAGLVYLKGLTNLQNLNLEETKITDAGLVHLKGLTNLEILNLAHTQVTDAGLVHLKELTNLKMLDLAHTQVTDASLAHLKGMTNLEYLWLANTKVSDAGVKELKAALPNCDIFRL